MLTTEAFNDDQEKGMDLVMTSTSPETANTAISNDVVQVITATEYKSSVSGGLNSLVSKTTAVAGGNGTHLVFINTDTSNDAHTVTAGKVVVYIKIMGSGGPVADTTV